MTTKAAWWRAVAALALSVLTLTGCGDGGDTAPPPTTTVTAPPRESTPDTTGYADNPCFKFPVEVLKLQNDYRLESRGVAGPPDKSRYRERAQALVDEANRLGCPEPVGLSSFLGG